MSKIGQRGPKKIPKLTKKDVIQDTQKVYNKVKESHKKQHKMLIKKGVEEIYTVQVRP